MTGHPDPWTVPAWDVCTRNFRKTGARCGHFLIQGRKTPTSSAQRQHYAEPLYARNVAAVSGLTTTRLRLAFQQTLQIPLMKYLQAYRVHRAALLLRAGTHNVTEVSLACGFQSLSHFIRTFRSQVGVTPRFHQRKSLSKRQKDPVKKARQTTGVC